MTTSPPERTAVTFQGKDPGEVFHFYFRQHWIRMVWPFVRVSVLTALLIPGYLFLSRMTGQESESARHGILLLLVTFLCIVQWDFLQRFYRHFLNIVIITDRKIHRIKKTLLVTDTHQSIDLWALQDIQKSQQGIVQNMLGFGTIILEAQESVLRIHFVPQITKRYEDLLHLRELARIQEIDQHQRRMTSPSPVPPTP